MVVRSAGLQDIGQVVELERSAVTAPHWTVRDYGQMVTGVGMRRCLLVAEEGGTLIGFAVGKLVVGEGELESVVVGGAWERQGFGRALCKAVQAWAREEGAGRMLLEVRAGSAAAIRLYGGLGFVEVGRRRGYYSNPAEDAVLMELELL